MAVTLDATSEGNGLAGTTLTFSHTIGVGSGRLLVVTAAGRTAANVSGITFNGVALTKVGERDDGSTETSIWYLEDPDEGTHDIVVTKASGIDCDAGGISFFGAQVDEASFTTAANFGTSHSLAITTNHSEGYVVTVVAVNEPGTLTYTGPGTEFFSEGSDPGYRAAYDDFSGGSDVTHSWSSTNNRGSTLCGIEIYPSGTAYSQGCDETITLNDSLVRLPTKALSEAVTLVDSIARSVSRAFSDAVTLVDTIAKQPSRFLSESLSLVDSLTSLRTKVATLSETVTLVEAFNRVVARAFSEAVTLVDTVANQLILTRSFVEEVIINEAIAAGRTAFTSLTESVIVTDAITLAKKAVGLLRGIARNTLTGWGSSDSGRPQVGKAANTNTKMGTHKDE